MANVPSVNLFRTAAPNTLLAPVALTTTDTLEYKRSVRQVLKLRNDTGSSTTVTIIGADAPNDYRCPGTGMTEDLTAGFAVTIADGAERAINLNVISAYLEGAVTLVSVAPGVEALLMES